MKPTKYDLKTRYDAASYNEAIDDYEAWLEEVFSVKNIKDIIAYTPVRINETREVV